MKSRWSGGHSTGDMGRIADLWFQRLDLPTGNGTTLRGRAGTT
jgi:hypothetical protein